MLLSRSWPATPSTPIISGVPPAIVAGQIAQLRASGRAHGLPHPAFRQRPGRREDRHRRARSSSAWARGRRYDHPHVYPGHGRGRARSCAPTARPSTCTTRAWRPMPPTRRAAWSRPDDRRGLSLRIVRPTGHTSWPHARPDPDRRRRHRRPGAGAGAGASRPRVDRARAARRPSRAVGAGIQLGPNGVRVLQRLGVADALRPLVGVPEAIAVHDGQHRRALSPILPLGDWIAARHGAPYWVAHRGDLHAALLAAASAEPAHRAAHRALRVASARADRRWRARPRARAARRWPAPRSSAPTACGRSVRQAVCPAVVAAVRRRHGDAHRHSRRRGGRAGDAGGRPVADARRACRALSGAAGAEIAVVVIAAEDWQGATGTRRRTEALLLAQLAGFHASLADVAGARRRPGASGRCTACRRCLPGRAAASR